MRREEPQLEPDPALGQQRKTFIGRVDYTEPEPAQPELPPTEDDLPNIPDTPRRKTWPDILSDEELTEEAFDRMVKSAKMVINAHKAQQSSRRRGFDNTPIIKTPMSYEQQGRNPYDLDLNVSPKFMTPREAHQQGLIHPYTLPSLLASQFIEDVQNKASQMSARAVRNSMESLRAASGFNLQNRISESWDEQKAILNAAVKAARQGIEWTQEAAEEAARIHREVILPEMKRNLGRTGIALTEAGKAYAMDIFNADEATKAIAAATGLDPEGEDVKLARSLGYGAGTIASFATPGLGGLKAANLGLKGIKAAGAIQKGFQLANKLPPPTKKFLKDVSIAGLQGALAAPEGVAMSDFEGQLSGRFDQLRNAATTAALTGGLGLAGGKFGSFSKSMGFAGKGKGPTDDVLDGLSKQTQFKDKNIIVPQEFKDSGKIRVPLDQPPVYSDDYNWPKSVNMEHLIEHPNPELKGLYIPTKDFVLPGPSNQYNVPYLQENFVTVAPYKPGRMVESDYLIQQENKYFSEKGHLIMDPNKLFGENYIERGWSRTEKIQTTDNPVAIYIWKDRQSGIMTQRPQRDEVLHLFDPDFHYYSRSSATGANIMESLKQEPKFKHNELRLKPEEIKALFLKG